MDDQEAPSNLRAVCRARFLRNTVREVVLVTHLTQDPVHFISSEGCFMRLCQVVVTARRSFIVVPRCFGP